MAATQEPVRKCPGTQYSTVEQLLSSTGDMWDSWWNIKAGVLAYEISQFVYKNGISSDMVYISRLLPAMRVLLDFVHATVVRNGVRVRQKGVCTSIPVRIGAPKNRHM
jgi:hypothetical protein